MWALERGLRPSPFVAIWPRGGAKSTNAEMACVAVGARKRRRYGLYVSETQDQADDHVSNVAAMLESQAVETYYPEMADRLVGKYGNSKGWRRNRLRTAGGFTLDGIGLDSAARGAKVDEDRPDFIVLDDLDGENDTLAATEKKIRTLTRKLLPAGAADHAILAIQNLVLESGIFGRMVSGDADYLADRILSGPHPALHNLSYEQRDGRFVLLTGEPTWAGQDLQRCQEMVDTEGLSAFLSEAQHEVEPPAGGLFDHIDFGEIRVPWESKPAVTLRTVVAVDPAVTDTDSSDSHGIQADTLAEDGTIYRLFSWEGRTSPLDVLVRAVKKARELLAETVIVETDQGGDTWLSVFRAACDIVIEDEKRDAEAEGRKPDLYLPRFTSEKAGSIGSKTHRAQQMLADYEKGRIRHCMGTHSVLEKALRRFPKTKPFDLVDSAYWSWRALRHGSGSFREMEAKRDSSRGKPLVRMAR